MLQLLSTGALVHMQKCILTHAKATWADASTKPANVLGACHRLRHRSDRTLRGRVGSNDAPEHDGAVSTACHEAERGYSSQYCACFVDDWRYAWRLQPVRPQPTHRPWVSASIGGPGTATLRDAARGVRRQRSIAGREATGAFSLAAAASLLRMQLAGMHYLTPSGALCSTRGLASLFLADAA